MHLDQNHASFRTGLAGYGISDNDGIVQWDIICDNISPQKYVFVGVAEWPSSASKQHKLLESYLGGTTHCRSWGYYSVSKKCYSQSQTKSYGSQYSTGDTVTVTLDMVEDKLSFAINGEDQGIAYSGCFRGRVLFPAVSLYGPAESVTIQFSSKFSSTFVSEEEISIARQADTLGAWSYTHIPDEIMQQELDSKLNCKIYQYPNCVSSVVCSKMALVPNSKPLEAHLDVASLLTSVTFARKCSTIKARHLI